MTPTVMTPAMRQFIHETAQTLLYPGYFNIITDKIMYDEAAHEACMVVRAKNTPYIPPIELRFIESSGGIDLRVSDGVYRAATPLNVYEHVLHECSKLLTFHYRGVFR